MRTKKLVMALLASTCLLVADPVIGRYKSIIPGSQVSGKFEFKILEDINGFKFKHMSNTSKSEALYDKNKNFISMYRELYQSDNFNIIGLLNQDYFNAKLSTNKKELLINYELKGKKLKSKKIKLKEDYKIFDNLFFTLQNDLQHGVKDFESFLIFPESGSGYKASFNFYKTRTLLEKTPWYNNVPDFFTRGSTFKEDVVVCEVGLLGMAGKFFPHKFNFVFQNGGDYEFIGYWGGNPKTPNYYISDNKIGVK